MDGRRCTTARGSYNVRVAFEAVLACALKAPFGGGIVFAGRVFAAQLLPAPIVLLADVIGAFRVLVIVGEAGFGVRFGLGLGKACRRPFNIW